jgi:stage V sporulation protein B
MRDKQTTAKGFTILSTAGIINKLLALVYLPIQTMVVADYGNGIISAGYKIYIFMFAVSNAGIPVAISKLVSEETAKGNYRDSQRILKVAGAMLFGLGILCSLSMALGAHWISQQVEVPEAYLTILALSPTMLFTAISASFKGYFQGRLNIIPTAISQVLEQALNSLLTIVFVTLLIRYGVEIAAAGTTIGTSVGALGGALFLIYIYYRNRKKIYNEINESKYNGPYMTKWEIARKIFIFSFPMIVGIIAINTSDLIDLKFGVGRIIAGGIDSIRAYELYGIFTNQFQKILNLPLAVTAALPAVLIPAVSTAVALKDNDTLNRKITESFKAMLLIVIPSATILALLPKPIITLVFFKYNSGSDLMMMGSWIIILLAVIYIQTATLTGIGRPYIPPINMLIGLSVKAIINYNLIAVPQINIKGAIIGTSAGYLIACTLNQIMIRKYVKITLQYRKLIVKPVISSLAMGVTAYSVFYLTNFLISSFIHEGLLLNDICIILSITIGITVYFTSLLLLKAVKSNDIQKLPMGNKINAFLLKFHIFKSILQ